MNKSGKLKARIIDWLRKQKVFLGFAIAAAITAFASAYLSLCPVYEGLSARLIAIAGGFLAVAVLYQTMRRAAAAENANIQRTFSDAITHLGHKSESVVLGGIHSLLDLAKENEDYRLKVFNILCAHIKTTTTEGEYQKKHQEHPSLTIQTLLDLLFKSKEYSFFTVDPAKYGADLSGAYLAGSNLYGARLQDSNLAGAKLQRAHLEGAQLQRARLWGAQLQGADLTEASLREAFLREAQLQGAFLAEAQLQDADLTIAQLQGAFLKKAKLRGAKLLQTGMQGSYIDKTELPRATDMGDSYLGGVTPVLGFYFLRPQLRISLPKFQDRIRNQKGKEADLRRALFDKEAEEPEAFQDSGQAIEDPYSEEDADRWIKQFEDAIPWEKDKG